MSTAGTLSTDAYVAAGTPLVVLCGGFVAVRCFMSIRAFKKLLIDDYLSIFGLALVIVVFAMNDIIIKRFTDPNSSLSGLLEVGVVITVIIAFELWTTKVPILIVYVKIFGIRKWLVYFCYATLAVSAVAYICAMTPAFMRCDTDTETTTPEEFAYCVTGTTLTGVISGFIALAQDLIIFVLPMPLIYGLQLAGSKKVALGAVFFSGILGIGASIVSLYFKFRAYNGETADTLTTMLCAIIEGTIAIMVGCAPSIKSFWGTIFSPRRYSNMKVPSSTTYTTTTSNFSRTKHFSQQGDEIELMGPPTYRSYAAPTAYNSPG